MKSKTSKKDHKLIAAILIVIAVFLIASLPFFVSMRKAQRFNQFKSVYTTAMNEAHARSKLKVQKGEESYLVPLRKASDLYTILIRTGMGKEQKKIPSGDPLLLDLGNGTTLEFWEVGITERSRERDLGVFVRYQNEDGYLYQYDTDRIDFDTVLLQLERVDRNAEG